MLTTKNIVVEKHARVFTFGDVEMTNEVWLLFHGYAQNSVEFFNEFEPFKDGRTFVIPEGLSRFYQKGISGKVGASWMTSEDRELEIKDQINYLNEVYKTFKLSDKKINVFAFSQGAMTAARWIEHSKIKTNQLIFWSGNIPFDIATNPESFVNQQNPAFFIGENDQFAPMNVWKKFFDAAPHYKPNIHNGTHFFTAKELKQFIFK